MHTTSSPVVHLDIKPENILVYSLLRTSVQVEDGSLVADFGLRKFLRSLGKSLEHQVFRLLRSSVEKILPQVLMVGGVLTELFGGRPLYTSIDTHNYVSCCRPKKYASSS